MARDGPSRHLERRDSLAPLPLPEAINRHGRIVSIEQRLHVETRRKENPHIKTGADEGRNPAAQALPNCQKQVRDREHGRSEFDPARIVPGTYELNRQLANHVDLESGGANPGSTFMTKINWGAPVAERVISSVR